MSTILINKHKNTQIVNGNYFMIEDQYIYIYIYIYIYKLPG
jgi:hypothetical protein